MVTEDPFKGSHWGRPEPQTSLCVGLIEAQYLLVEAQYSIMVANAALRMAPAGWETGRSTRPR